MNERHYFVYILASKTRTLYVGVTRSLERRVIQHKTKEHEGFTAKYDVHTLVYYESFTDVQAAIAREKQIKGWRRDKKIALIESMNPTWLDLACEWFTEWQEEERRLAELKRGSTQKT